MLSSSDHASAITDHGSSRVFSRMIKLSRGMFTLRYLAADDARHPPCIGVQLGPDAGGIVQVIGAPGAEPGFLRKPGNAVVLLSGGDAVVVVTTFVGGRALADGVKLKLDQVDCITSRDGQFLGNAEAGRAAAAQRRPAIPIFLSGHVEGHGDLSLAAGARLGDAETGCRIEGFAIHWPKRPHGVDIAYSCFGTGDVPPEETLTGDFVGSRGEGRGITGVFARLIGEKAARFTLEAEAVFSDGTRIQSSAGGLTARAIEADAGLVALSVAVRHRQPSTQGEEPTGGDPPKADNAVMESAQAGEARLRRAVGIRLGRIRLFRGLSRVPGTGLASSGLANSGLANSGQASSGQASSGQASSGQAGPGQADAAQANPDAAE